MSVVASDANKVAKSQNHVSKVSYYVNHVTSILSAIAHITVQLECLFVVDASSVFRLPKNFGLHLVFLCANIEEVCVCDVHISVNLLKATIVRCNCWRCRCCCVGKPFDQLNLELFGWQMFSVIVDKNHWSTKIRWTKATNSPSHTQIRFNTFERFHSLCAEWN